MLKNLIILPDGTEVFSGNARDNAIISCEFSQFVNDGAELSIGSACCNELEVKLFATNIVINANDEIQYYKVSGNGNRTKIGVFRCEKPTVTGTGTYKFVAYDRVSWLDKDLTDWISSLNGWPYSAENFARMVCEACGLTLATTTLPNGDYQIRKFSGSGVTGRMLMQWLGQITCRFIRANADGKIEFAWYTDKGKEITTRGEFAYFGGGLSYEDFTVAEIQKVQIQASENDNGTVYPDGNEEELNTYKITGNYLLTAETGNELKPVAQTIFEQLQGVTYTPCKVSIQATTEINAGDIVHITDRNGVTITTYVMSKTNKGQKDTLECTGSYKRDSSTATNTLTMKALNGKVLDIKKDVDGLRIENKDTAGKVAKLELSTTEITASVESVKKTSEEALKEAQKNATDLTNYANQVSGSLTDLQNQIDGAIETWFYDYEPTTTNAPASSWTTTEDKNKHLGDLFYIVDNEDKGGLVYRWALTNSVYGWVLVEDTEVAKALETASKAKDTADKKRRVFVSHPTPPYDVGDLWTNNTDLYVCQTARSSGNYTASDWKLATEYTTEKAVKALIKVAEESISLSVKSVEEKADGAASAASKAQKTADGIEVGGRNLIIGASKYRESTPAVTGTSSDAYVYLTDTSVMLEKGKTYTLQACSDLPWSTGHGSGAGLGKGTIWIASVDRKYHRVFLGDGVTAGRYVWKFEHAGDTGEYQIRVNGYVTPAKFWDFKVESGNKPTDWTPAPEDTDEDIKGLQDDLASISDEVSVLKVTSKGVDMVSEDSNGRLVSFIGNRDTGGAWEAKYTKNGSVASALYFDFAKGSFVFDGHVVARSGEIGGCLIVGGNLQVPAANIDGTLTASQIDISVGGRNYLRNSSFNQNFNNWYALGNPEISTIDGATCGHFMGELGTEKCVSQPIIQAIDTNDLSQTYVFSADIRLDNFIAGTTNCYVALYFGGADTSGEWLGAITISGDEYLDRFNDKGWVRVYRCVKFAKKPVRMDAFIYARDFTGDLYFKNVKFERGNKATDWTPAPEDTEATVTKITNDTIATTNVVAQNLHVKAANIDGALTFGNGSYYIDPGATTSYLKLPGLEITSSGATFEGRIIAERGEIGGFTIGSTSLEGGLIRIPASTVWSNANVMYNGTLLDGSYLRVFRDAAGIVIGSRLIGFTNLNTGLSVPMIQTDSDGNASLSVHSISSGEAAFAAIGNPAATIISPAKTEWRYNDAVLGNIDVSGSKVYVNGTYEMKGDFTFVTSIYGRNPLYIGHDTSGMQLRVDCDYIDFAYAKYTVGKMVGTSGYVNITGTWRTNGSAWIPSSDARLKNTIEDFTPAHDILFDHLRPRTYKWNEGTSGRTHSGFIVQEVVEAVGKAGLTTKDFAAVVNFKNDNGEDDGWGLRYEELISLNTWQIQKLKARIAELEERLKHEVN